MTLVYKGEGELNERASMLANQPIYGPAVLHFGGVKGKTLHSLLRPGIVFFFSTNPNPKLFVANTSQLEFVKTYKCRLSSDAFTLFGSIDSNIHNREVKEATTYLQTQIIPR